MIYRQPSLSKLTLSHIILLAQTGAGDDGSSSTTLDGTCEAGCSGQFSSSFQAVSGTRNIAVCEVVTDPALSAIDGCLVTLEYGSPPGNSGTENYTLPDANCDISSSERGVFVISCDTSESDPFRCTIDCSVVNYGSASISDCDVSRG